MESKKDAERRRRSGHSALTIKRGLGWPCRDLGDAPWPLPPRGALHVRGERGPNVRDVLPFRVCLLRGALRLPYGVVPRVRDALLPCDDALLPALT